jgi:hypothetical protein
MNRDKLRSRFAGLFGFLEIGIPMDSSYLDCEKTRRASSSTTLLGFSTIPLETVEKPNRSVA